MDEHSSSERQSAAQKAPNESRGDDGSQRNGFGFQRSPSGAGIRQPTRFNQSDSQDNASNHKSASSAQHASNVPKPPLNMSNVAAASQQHAQSAESAAVFDQVTPRQTNKQQEVDESLLTTPSISEKKTMLNSLLSDDEASQFEPTTRASQVSASGRKKAATRTSIAALSTTAQKDNVKVVIRVRPINDREKAGGPADKVKLCLAVERNEKLTLDRGMDQKTFTFDYVAEQDSEQSILFERIARPITDSCLQGYNGTIFAYGQTGSGKTFTIQGPTMLINGEETLIGATASKDQMHEKRGLMQRSFEYMFDCMENEKMEAQKQGIEMQFLVKTSYLEIYNEQIMDLLDPQSYNLHVREDIKKGVYVEGLNEETVNGVKDMMNLTTRGARNRHVGSTLMNKESSRSHSVLTTTIESKTMNEEGVWQMKSSRFHIIDLAGSERSKNTNAVGERLKEAGMINKSLTALGIVINSLVEVSEGKKRHVHYRDSKLTFLLRDSLGGNSKTVIIANVTAAAISVGETLSTLKFAQRAKLIKNKAVINEESSSTIHLLKAELRMVKKNLAEQTNQLKIAHDQLTNIRESIPEVQNESINESSSLCKVCKKEISSQDGDDLNLHFVDTSGLFHSHTGGSMIGDNQNDSVSLDMISDKTPGGTSMGVSAALQANNPKAFKMYKQRTIELQAMKERVSKVEHLLSENLENMDISQKQYEQQLGALTKSNKDKQTALEASEKNRARDKMIIKFREERIAELEARLTKAEDCSHNATTTCDSITSEQADCALCLSLKKELSDARTEISQWVEVSDKNPQAAKLFAEKEELLAQKAALQQELQVTPESLSARIRGLNEMTSDLNAYLKEYCMSEGFDRLKQELEQSKMELTQKVESLETELSQKDGLMADKAKSLSEDYDVKMAAWNEKLELVRQTFDLEKTKIEKAAQDQMTQLKANLDATLAEKGELQKEVYDKVEAHEKQLLLQKSIDSLSKTLEELQQEKATLEIQLLEEKVKHQNINDLQKQAEAQLNDQINQLNQRIEEQSEDLTREIKDVQQKANEEIQVLETEVATTKEENRMHHEKNSDLERKLRGIQQENDSLSKQILETNEEIQEKRRHVKEIETKLNSTIKDSQGKTDSLSSMQLKLETQIAENQVYSQQICELQASLQTTKTEQSSNVTNLQQQMAQLTQEKEHVSAQVQSQQLKLAEMEKNEQILQRQVEVTEGKVELCARYEVEQQVLQKKVESYESELAQITEKFDQAVKQSQIYNQEVAGVKEQVTAMEELTVSLTQQAQEKDQEISQLRTSVTEKDLELAKTLSEIEQGKNHLKSSLQEEQRNSDAVKSKIVALQVTLDSEKQQNEMDKNQLQDKIKHVQQELSQEKETCKKEAKKAENAKQKCEEMIIENQKLLEQIKQELKAEAQNHKFELDLKYETQFQNRENELRQTFQTNQSKDQEAVQTQQGQIQSLRLEVQKQKQARQSGLLMLQGKLNLLRQEHAELIKQVQKDLTWARVGPKPNMIKSLVGQVQLISQEHANLKQFMLESIELKEQLVEYKGLTQQLQEEKKSLNARLHENLEQVDDAKIQNSEIIDSLNTQLQTTQTELAEAHQMLFQHKSVAEESIKKLNQQKVEQFQKMSEESQQVIRRLTDEAEQLRQSRADAQNDLLKYKTKTSEQSNLLMSSKETISNMVSKENQLMSDLKRKITELGEQQEQYKARVTQSKQEKEAITSKYETLKKENENLRELIKIKDGQIEDSRGYEAERRGERERIYAEVRKKNEMILKRDTEIKEIVLTLKAFADEKKRLEKEVERMRTDEQSTGHNNQAQKIQHHLRIKEENNKLKEENYALQEQVRKFLVTNSGGGAQAPGALNSNATFGNLANDAIISQQQTQQTGAEIEKARKEITGLHDSVARLAEHLLKLPGVGQFVSSNDQLATHFKKHPLPQGASSTSSATYYATQKLKGTSEVIMNICKQLQSRVQECNQMTQEFKRMEHEIQKLQMEKSMVMQANPQLAQQVAQQMLQQMQQQQQEIQSNTRQQPSSSTMQPSFQVQASTTNNPQSRSITQQQQQSLAPGQQPVNNVPNQYRRTNSRGAPAQQQQQQQSVSQNVSHLQQQQQPGVSQQSNLAARQLHLMQQQQQQQQQQSMNHR